MTDIALSQGDAAETNLVCPLFLRRSILPFYGYFMPLASGYIASQFIGIHPCDLMMFLIQLKHFLKDTPYGDGALRDVISIDCCLSVLDRGTAFPYIAYSRDQG